MTHGSLFSGIGGFDYAAQQMGWENLFHCEWDERCRRVLQYYWPAADSFRDITKSDFTGYANRIDVLTGGFPCQPYSSAGRQLGTEDERHLWPQMLRAIREIAPRWVVGENVRGLVSWNGGLVFEQVQADLEAEGYQVLPFLLPACGVNAPHQRDRIWFVAYCARLNGALSVQQWRQEQAGHAYAAGQVSSRPAADAGRQPWNGWQNAEGGGEHYRQAPGRQEGANLTERLRQAGLTPYAGGIRLRGEIDRIGASKLIGENSPATHWDHFPTQSPVCSRNDGLSSRLVGITLSKHRKFSLKSYGNAVVPPLVLQIFQAIEAYEKGGGA